jgi:hypothetical protein
MHRRARVNVRICREERGYRQGVSVWRRLGRAVAGQGVGAAQGVG